MPNFSTGSPGYLIGTLLDNLPEDLIRKIIGPEIVETLRIISPELVDKKKLCEFSKTFTNPDILLSDMSMRNQIIMFLPPEKARELVERLDIKSSLDPYQDIKQAKSDSDVKKIKQFFGINIDRDLRIIGSEDSIKIINPEYSLFDHQIDAAIRTKEKLYMDPYKVILHMPTGAGKTRTAMHIVSEHLANHRPTIVCWLATTKELLDQAAEEFEQAWKILGNRKINIYRFWQEHKIDLRTLKDGFLVAGYKKIDAAWQKDQTLLASLGEKTSLIVADEAHQTVAHSYREIIEAICNMRIRNALLGLTATPGRTWADMNEDRRLVNIFKGNKVILKIKDYKNPITYLINQGYIAQPDFRTLNINAGLQLGQADLANLAEQIDFPEEILNSLGDSEQINIKIIHEIREMTKRHQRIMFFAASVKQASLVNALLNIYSIRSFLVTGDTPKSKRNQQINQYKSNSLETMVICNYNVLTAGFDAPKTSAILITRPTKSLVLYSQMVGRAIRGIRAGGNKKAEIVTVVDPSLPSFGDIVQSFENWEDVWNE